MRLISRHVLLYTEMVTSAALVHGDAARLLEFNRNTENPVVLQVGGSSPNELAFSAQLAAKFGYDEINLNVGCPSSRVQAGRFGACLMAEPTLVRDCVAAMREAVPGFPVTVKTRIGIDEQDSYEELRFFIETVAAAGCDVFIIHARKAWLSGLSPKENREVPPLRYDVVQCLKQDFPNLTFILNGGIRTLEDIKQHLEQFDGIMLGRAAYSNPYMLASIDNDVHNDRASPMLSRAAIVDAFLPYVEQQMKRGVSARSLTRHLMGLYEGQPGARAWRRKLSEVVAREDSFMGVVTELDFLHNQEFCTSSRRMAFEEQNLYANK